MHQTAHNLFCLPTDQDWTTLVQSLVESGCTLTAQVQVDTVFIPFTYTLFLPCELQNMKFFERISLSLKFGFFFGGITFLRSTCVYLLVQLSLVCCTFYATFWFLFVGNHLCVKLSIVQSVVRTSTTSKIGLIAIQNSVGG